MASTSSSSPSSSTKWQVFVSFRGEDTRNNFKSHLEAALRRRSINAYIDNINLKAGDEISPGLKEAIQGSRIALVVLSENYASSAWCLNELLWILECRENNNQVVIPIFYHVDPSDVRYQKEGIKDALDKLLIRKRSDEEVKEWKSALTQVANLSGHHFSNQRSEHEFIEEIVEDISTRLTFGCSNNFRNLVGIHSRIGQVTSLLLHSKSKEVVIVGIWGMGGIGKTTIAEAVFYQISDQFEGHCFLPNVREQSEKNGVNFLRNKLVSSVLGDYNIKIETSLVPPVIQDRLRCKKVLIVIDDVKDPDQLDTLLCNGCFGRGSRILITSRDRQVLQQVVDHVYEVQGLFEGEDLKLFNLFAFKDGNPKDDLMALSDRLVKCAQGVPLALKVLGSAMKGKSSTEWKGFLDKLKDTPNKDIQKILRVSYDDLDDKQKDLFIDIACFFKGTDRVLMSEIYGASSDYDIGVLIDKSLITKGSSLLGAKVLDMHDQLQEMGRDIVRQESNTEPGKRSRLWKHKDVHHVLKNNTGTEAVEGIVLNLSMRELHISPTAFAKMTNLRILRFYSDDDPHNTPRFFRFNNILDDYFIRNGVSKLRVKGDKLSSISDGLNYLRWDKYPLKSLPLHFCAESLVRLIMPFSNLEKLWDGEQNLANLKQINLKGSKNLLEIPNLSQARNLKSMDLGDCVSLCDLPKFIGLTSLETLNLEGCSKITKLREISESIEMLNLSGTGIQEVPVSIGGFSRLKSLKLRSCKQLQIIPDLSQARNLESMDLSYCISLCHLPSCTGLTSLETLNLEGCSKITKFPEIFESIRELKLSGTGIQEVPASVRGFSRLKYLELNHCKLLQIISGSICQLESLKDKEIHLSSFSNLEKSRELLGSVKCLYMQESVYKLSTEQMRFVVNFDYRNSAEMEWFQNCISCMTSLKELRCKIDPPDELSRCLTSMFSLKYLNLSGNNLKSIPESIKQLSALEKLKLTFCRKLQSIPELPIGLKYLIADKCYSLKPVSTPLTTSACVRTMTFLKCYNLDTRYIENEAQNIILRRAHGDVKLCTKGCINNPPLIIRYDGSEIPKWFIDNSTESDEITIKLPQCLVNDNKCLGIAFVAIIKYDDEIDGSQLFYNKLKLGVKCGFKSENGVSHQFQLPLVPSDFDSLKVSWNDPTHVVVMGYSCGWHCELLKFGESHFNEASFFFSYSIFDSRSVEEEARCKINKCGVRLLYNSVMSHTILSSL